MLMKCYAKGYFHGQLFMTSNRRSTLTSLHIRMNFSVAFLAHLTSIYYVLNLLNISELLYLKWSGEQFSWSSYFQVTFPNERLLGKCTVRN